MDRANSTESQDNTATAETHTLSGLHHVTAIASDPQRNHDFYTGTLGLRLVKLTVNYDDPGSYHFYYGDGLGRPGTLITFFAWPGAIRGRLGVGQIAATAFAVPVGSLDYWAQRLRAAGITVAEPRTRFGEQVLSFSDPDGLILELIETPDATARTFWERGPVPAEFAIHGLHSVTLYEDGHDRTASALTGLLGFRLAGTEERLRRYATGAGGAGASVDVLDVRASSLAQRGRIANGTAHHVAWRTPDDAAQIAWLAAVTDAGLHSSPVMDRQYFHSIYFREPGGVLFEIATDAPGFTTDETPERLGTTLKLPSWLESHRAVIEEALPRLTLPTPVGDPSPVASSQPATPADEYTVGENA